ncbi:hypothetical protein [Fodinibius saliphilus]|uniref:hypothetical protein n=1 Tax=Fodinibius saliphilus TaxID=1920650 RepID=UPI001108278A|nr:hypothetical protein [Fodinibius saliphilus]
MYSEKFVFRTVIGVILNLSEDEILSRFSQHEVHWQTYGISVPVMSSYLVGKDKKFLELGGGVTFQWVSEKHTLSERYNNFEAIPSLHVGYRRQPAGKGFVFRVVAGPLLYDNLIFPHIGLSFGFVK